MIEIKIEGHLLIPFGRPKWDIKKIKIVGVSTSATYFESETPCVYIDSKRNDAIRLRDATSVLPGEFPSIEDSLESLAFIRKYLKEQCDVQTDAERDFLDLYFAYCVDKIKPDEWELNYYKGNVPYPKDNINRVFDALFPMPQAHLYLEDPLQRDYSFVPKNMVKVDFAFWTGEEIIAVEIDGSSHAGSEWHVRKDRLLQRSGVKVIHILNSELTEHGKEVFRALFPNPLVYFWHERKDKYPINPLSDEIPF